MPATSLRILRGAPVDRAQLLADLVAAIEARYRRFEAHGFTGPRARRAARTRVELAGGARGRCDGVDESGRLVVSGVAHTSAEVTAVLVGAESRALHFR